MDNRLSIPDGNDSLAEYTARVLEPWSPIIVSNRAPFEPGPRGQLRKGSGGLVTALLTVAEATSAPWVACARTAGERELASGGSGAVEVPGRNHPLKLHYVNPDPKAYDGYYSVISNPLLWFIHHYLYDLTNEPVIDEHYWEAWRDGYVKVNEMFAERVAEVARDLPRNPLVLTQDYQLYVAPRLIRELIPAATLQQFIHIPWPTARYWMVLPQAMREPIMEGLLANDVIGFQTNLDVRNFLITVEETMGLRVDHRERAVLHEGRVTWVRAYPISVDVPAMERMAASAGVRREVKRIEAWRPEKLVVRVDRTDPSKNIVRGFLAYERMLRQHPELQGKVEFYAFLQPSRQDIRAYRAYLRSIRRTAAQINSELGTSSWRPIRLELGQNMRRAIAAYREFDVLLVNPMYDGMNLVAKEGALVNQRQGVLVLSENAGAHEELGEWVLTVNPFDVDATADAIHLALTAPDESRKALSEAARQIVRTNDIGRWLSLQIRDLRDLVAPERPSRQAG